LLSVVIVHLKKMITILLSAVFLFNIGGYRLILSHLQSRAANETAAATMPPRTPIKSNLLSSMAYGFSGQTGNKPVHDNAAHITGIFSKFDAQNPQWALRPFKMAIAYLQPRNITTNAFLELAVPGKPPNNWQTPC